MADAVEAHDACARRSFITRVYLRTTEDGYFQSVSYGQRMIGCSDSSLSAATDLEAAQKTGVRATDPNETELFCPRGFRGYDVFVDSFTERVTRVQLVANDAVGTVLEARAPRWHTDREQHTTHFIRAHGSVATRITYQADETQDVAFLTDLTLSFERLLPTRSDPPRTSSILASSFAWMARGVARMASLPVRFLWSTLF